MDNREKNHDPAEAPLKGVDRPPAIKEWATISGRDRRLWGSPPGVLVAARLPAHILQKPAYRGELVPKPAQSPDFKRSIA